jgi:2-polyprenyl-6-methoxyphenol hydroxylase-like FAD-dependent oxidoreductase
MSPDAPIAPGVDYETEVLVSGGGPVGLMMSYQLAQKGISCMMVEQGTRTSSYPKMEFACTRTMEIFRRLGLIDRLRAVGVPDHHVFNEIYSSGLSRKDGCLTTVVRHDYPRPQLRADKV